MAGFTLVEFFAAGEEDSLLFSSVGSTVVFTQSQYRENVWKDRGIILTTIANRRIHHHDVVLVMFVQVIHQLAHLLQWETLRIQSEHPAAIHVVNISPHGLQRNVSTAVVVDNLSNIIDILVSIAAVVILKKNMS
jgi:hypothetical protein